MAKHLFLGLSLLLIMSCGTERNRLPLSSDEGISWINITDCNEKRIIQSYGYGFTLLSSGKGYEFVYDYETQKRTPVYFQCMDCGYPQTINEALVNWKLENDTLKISRYRFYLDIYAPIIVRNIKEDSLFLSEIRGKNNFECKYIMIKLKNSILDTLIADNILSPKG